MGIAKAKETTRPGAIDPRSLCDPRELAKLGGLDLIANRVVEGLLAGKHRSPFKGSSVEFAEHRPYSQGDEIRCIDWRVLGRRDRYYIREFERETNLQAWLVLDTSGSMDFGLSTVTKLQYGRMAAAVLARLLLNQGDAVALVGGGNAIDTHIPPRSTPSHFNVIVESLTRMRAGGRTSLAGVLHDLAQRARRRGLVVIISDCFDDLEATCQALHRLHARGHELLLLHVMAPEERTFAMDRWSRFECMEGSGQSLELDPAVVRKAYLAEVKAFVERLQHGCGEVCCDYVPLSSSVRL